MHIIQSDQWAEFKKSTGVIPEKLPTDTYVYFSPVPHLPFTVGYCPRPEKLDCTELIQISKKHRAVFTKVDPILNFKNCPPTGGLKIIESTAILPQHTFILDLTLSEAEILRGMEEKTRYNIKIAQKYNVVIKKAESGSDVQIFCDLQKETAKRQNFHVKPDKYFLSMWEKLHPQKMMDVLLAYYNDRPISGITLLHYEDTLYYAYGGSLEEHREVMPNHLLHLEAIRLGQKQGFKNYDLWGAYKNTPEEKDPWFGIYRFKKGFGGKLITYPNSFDIIFNPILYTAYKIFR